MNTSSSQLTEAGASALANAVLVQKRVGSTIKFYISGTNSLSDDVCIASVLDGHDSIIFDPLADFAVTYDGTPHPLATQEYFDSIGLTVENIRKIDTMRTPEYPA